MVLEYQYDSSLWVYDPANAATTLDARELIDYLYVRAIISSDPSDADCVVVLVYWPDYQLCFARPGDAHWTWIRPPMENTQYNCVRVRGAVAGAASLPGEEEGEQKKHSRRFHARWRRRLASGVEEEAVSARVASS